MPNEIPREGDIHSVVKIENHIFELRYGYYEERDRSGGIPCLLLPDLASKPLYTKAGNRIVTAIQSVCAHYRIPAGRTKEDCCYTCSYYQDPRADISLCLCPFHQYQSPQEKGGNTYV